MNKIQGIFSKKKASPKWSPVTNTSTRSHVTVGNTTTTAAPIEPHGCCRESVDVVCMNPSTSKVEQQVEELEAKLAKESDLRMMYRKRLERTQDYLRYCLQVAQQNGFLNLILHQNDRADVVNNANGNASPQLPTTPPHQQVQNQHADLAALVDQANSNGWHINPDEIEIEEKVGQGSTAEIYRATWHGFDVAVKCINPEFFENENGVSFFAQELDTLCRQRHRYVLHLMGACLDPPNYAWVVTEFLSMTLKEWLHGPGNRQKERTIELPPLSDRVARALEIALAMQYLHEQKPKVVHRDLKPNNIFLDDADHVRVADFGHARFLDDEEKALTGETGTHIYMAPEVIKFEPYTEKCDVYSFGIILNELITGNYPYIETDYGPIKIAMEVVENKLRPRLPEDEDGQLEKIIELICLSWDGDASIRPSFATITCSLKKIYEKILYDV